MQGRRVVATKNVKVLFGISCACSENFAPLQTILDKNLEALWKILLPFVFPLPFAMLL